MIPLRDTAPAERFPLVNISLIFINVVVFIHQQMLGPEEIRQFIYTYGTVPAELTEGFRRFLQAGLQPQVLLSAAFPLVTANFLHGGPLHLIGNMIYLWVFGDNIEGSVGHLRFLLLYLLMGAGSQLFHIVFNPLSAIPLVGASGAIAGVLGAYFILYPRSRVLTLSRLDSSSPLCSCPR